MYKEGFRTHVHSLRTLASYNIFAIRVYTVKIEALFVGFRIYNI